MKQFNFEDNTLILKVKKAPIFMRGIMFLISFLSFILPLIGIIIAISLGNKFHFGFLIGVGFFGLIGFYLLRISLWNTYGEETIKFNSSEIEYEANYGWFKDGKKINNIDKPVYSIKQIGYVDDKKGALVLEEGNIKIESVVKIPINQLEELIEILKKVERPEN
jgi:energy-coupling factor transporter transmembrane protein EcfT